MESKLTIYDIAKEAGVSTATVSRAINPETRDKVAPATQKKIDQLVKKFSYTPSLAAKNMGLTKTKTIGVVFPYLPGIFYSEYYAHILSGVSDYLYDTAYKFKMLLLKNDSFQWDSFDFKAGENVDGLIIVHWFKFFSRKSVINRLKVPCVIINDVDKGIKALFISADQYQGGRLAAEHLLLKGHRNIGVLSGPQWSLDSRQRLAGFLEYCHENDVDIAGDHIVAADYLENTAYERVGRLLDADKKISAFFCCNDQMALGAMRRLHEMGCACPRDISIMGFDDEKDGQQSIPALTTIHVPIYQLARQAVALLIEHLQQDAIKTTLTGVIKEPVSLVERGSVATIGV